MIFYFTIEGRSEYTETGKYKEQGFVTANSFQDAAEKLYTAYRDEIVEYSLRSISPDNLIILDETHAQAVKTFIEKNALW